MDRKKEKREGRNGSQSSQQEAGLRWHLPPLLPRGCYLDYKLPTPGNQLVPLRLLKGPR